MSTQRTALVLASFAADSLALGTHWIYSTEQIDQQLGRVDSLRKPLPESYHANKEQGAFTHYGDQTLVLLESVAQTGTFSLTDFAAAWKALFTGYTGYVDKATAATLKNMNNNLPPDLCGSTSSDLGGAARIAPLLYFYRDDRQQLLEAVRQQTAMTHNNPATLAGAEFIAKTVWSVLAGTNPIAAMEAALEEGVNDIDLDNRIRGALDTIGKDTRTVIKKFGQMCGIAAALPGAIHLIATYETDLQTALIENVMAGGESAARGLVAGMVLGAHLGTKAIPDAWLSGMIQYNHITALLSSGAHAD